MVCIYKIIPKSFVLVFLLSACVTPIQLRKGPPLPADGSERTWAQTQHFLLWGLVRASRSIKMQEKCATSSWQSVSVNRSFIHVIASMLTLGLYVPVRVKWVCLTPSPTQNPSNELQEFEDVKELEQENLTLE